MKFRPIPLPPSLRCTCGVEVPLQYLLAERGQKASAAVGVLICTECGAMAVNIFSASEQISHAVAPSVQQWMKEIFGAEVAVASRKDVH